MLLQAKRKMKIYLAFYCARFLHHCAGTGASVVGNRIDVGVRVVVVVVVAVGGGIAAAAVVGLAVLLVPVPSPDLVGDDVATTTDGIATTCTAVAAPIEGDDAVVLRILIGNTGATVTTSGDCVGTGSMLGQGDAVGHGD
jgi:hypothetical protein